MWLDDLARSLLFIVDQRKVNEKIMTALENLKAGQAAIHTAVTDVAAFLKTSAGTIAGGVSADDANALAADFLAQAATLEALIPPPVDVPPPPPSGPPV